MKSEGRGNCNAVHHSKETEVCGISHFCLLLSLASLAGAQGDHSGGDGTCGEGGGG